MKKLKIITGCAVYLCIFIGAVIACLLAIFGISALIQWYYSKQFGNDTAWLATGTSTCLVIISCIMIILIWSWKLTRKSRGVSTRIAVGVTCLSIGMIVLSAGWYDRFTQDGVERHHFCHTTTYTWDDVDAFTLSSDHDGVLVYELHMQDGASFTLIGGDFHAAEYNSDMYLTIFPEGDLDYVIWLTAILKEKDCDFLLEDLTSIQVKLDYVIYGELAEEIWNLYYEETT